MYEAILRKKDSLLCSRMKTTPIYVTLNFSGTIFRPRGFVFVCLMWIAFPMSSTCDFAVGVAQGEVFMSWRTNWTDISEYRLVVNPYGANIIRFAPYNITGTAVVSYINKVRDIGNVSLGIVSFRLLSLTVGDAGRYYYKALVGSSDAGGQVLVIAGVPTNVSVLEVADPFENEKYTIQCSALSTSVPPGMGLTMHYQWNNEKGQNITVSDRYSVSSDQSNLTINPLKRQDTGTLICEAWEHVGAVSLSGPFSLKVFYGPDIGSIQLSPSNTFHEVAESSSFTVNCSTDCFPDCQYRWTGPGGSIIGNTGLLSIISVRRNQTGQYTCTASNSRIPYKTATTTTNVVVFYGPDTPFTLDPDTTSYRNTEGTFIPSITCLANCNPPCSYHWIGPLGAISSGVLSLEILDRLKQGSYFCIATNPRTSASVNGSTVHIVVIYGPNIPHLSPSTTVYKRLEGEAVPDIICSADCFPGCTQVWMKGVRAVQESSRGTLSLRQVYREKAGDYTCWFNNTESKATGYISITLDVQYPPVLTMKATNTSKGGRVVINCTASGVPDNYTFYKWTHMAPDVNRTIVRELEPTRVSGSEVSLTIDGATYQDTGFYVCKASNGIAHYTTGQLIMEDMESVWIADQPVVTSDAQYFDVEKGKSAQVHIEFYLYLSQPLVTWYLVKNGTMELLQNSSDFGMYLSAVTVEVKYYQTRVQLQGYNASLEVVGVAAAQFTSYKVEINNGFGDTAFVTLELKPRGSPETPSNLSVVPDSVTTHSLQLSWRAGFHGGASQTFVIEYREAGMTNWLNKSEPRGLVLYVTLNTSIADLKDGTKYEFRIYSENVYNRSQVSSTVNETTKTVPGTSEGYGFGLPVAGIGGGISAGIVCIFVIGIGIFLWRRKQHKMQSEHDSDVLREHEKRNQINASSVKQDGDNGKDYEGLHFTEVEASQYLQLNGITLEENRNVDISLRSLESDSYEKLHPYVNSDTQMYSSLKIPKTFKDPHENTCIARPDNC